jgi:mannobiose 2-epimerase
LEVAKSMLDHALRNGWDKELGGFYDQGYYFKGDDEITIINDHKNWWSQAEGLNTLLLMADHYPDDELRYFEKFRNLWSYINEYLIDHEHGGWYEGGLDKQPDLKTALKGHIWKGNYHQFRSLIHCMQSLLPDEIPPSEPAEIRLREVGDKQVLEWEKATDDALMMGYNIYKNGKKIGFTPLTVFQLPQGMSVRNSEFSVGAVDLQGNESVASIAGTR